jgi:DNA excision repair protein ERCC-4
MRSAYPVGVVVDVFEQASGVPAALGRLGAEITIEPLVAGDYRIGDEILIERKTAPDLHGSLARNRLWAQLGRLRDTAPYPYLLVEGDDLDAGPRHPNAIRGALLAAADAGITLLRSRDPDDSASWINRLALRHARRTGTPRTHPSTRATQPPPFQDPRVGALAAVPGISTGTARTLLDHYGSIERLIAAGPDHWATIDGIGTIRTHALAATLLDRDERDAQPRSNRELDPPTALPSTLSA